MKGTHTSKRVLHSIQSGFWSITLNGTHLRRYHRPYAGPNTGYQKYIVFTHARSGSSLLTQLLKTHSQVLSFGELFVKRRIGFTEQPFNGKDRKLFYLRNKYPVEFLSDFVFSGWDDRYKAVGFKLFPDQIDNERFKPVWSWLRSHTDIKIIHLQRQNLLATYASHTLARQTRAFRVAHAADRSKITIHLDPRECEAFFTLRESYYRKGTDLFRDHKVLEVQYEQLDSDLETQSRAVQQFLGLDYEKLETQRVKQEVRPLNEVIEKYAELETRFRDSPWARYF